jgi:hypothetical protein
MSALLDLAHRLEDSGLGSSIAEGRYAFPIIEGTHLIGLSVAVGLLFLTDLRLVGLFLPEVPVRTLHRQLQPYILSGFALVMIAGVLLFFSEAASIIVSPPWPFKFAFMTLAGANALYFEFVIARRPQALPDRGPLPLPVRAAGFASLSLWVLVIICGRLIPYMPQWS